MKSLIEPKAAADQLRFRLEAAHARARRLGAPVLVSLSLPSDALGRLGLDPVSLLELYASARRAAGSAFYWRAPEDGRPPLAHWPQAMAGAGEAHALEARGPDRFASLARRWERLVADGDVEGGLPIAVCGGSFNDDPPAGGAWGSFGAARLLIPKLLCVQGPSGPRLAANACLSGEEDWRQVAADLEEVIAAVSAFAAGGRFEPPAVAGAERERREPVEAAAWKALVRQGAAAIRAGRFDKVVLARELILRAGGPIDPAAALRRLAEGNPDCFIFALSTGDSTFLGASPERLVRLAAGRVDAASLAGSASRGHTPQSDRRLGQALLSSAKDRREHAVVRQAILDGLASLGVDAYAPDEPVLHRSASVQHLYTPVTGEAPEGLSLLDLVGALHPTPAVGGFPRGAALAWLEAHEPLDRGWYAGPIGWIGADGSGECAVGLRSALIKGDEARLYAGCGVMGDSDPDWEYEESRLKMQPMLRALGAGAEAGSESAAGGRVP